jgi:hypothetical protein
MSLLGQLLDALGSSHQYRVSRDGAAAFFQRGGMQAEAHEVEGGLVEISYEHAPHEITRERCTPSDAARLIEAVFRRDRLRQVEPSASGNR